MFTSHASVPACTCCADCIFRQKVANGKSSSEKKSNNGDEPNYPSQKYENKNSNGSINLNLTKGTRNDV